MELELTKRQREVLDYITHVLEEKGFPPTIREIGKRFKISSTNGVRAILSALVRKGFIRRRPKVSRGIELIKQRIPSLVSVPLIGQIRAGSPVLAVENIESHIGVDKSLVTGGRVFSLRVEGDSMKDAGILDGDYVLARQQATAERGEIIIAVIGEEATVKRYSPLKERIKLMPANPAYEPIVIEKNKSGLQNCWQSDRSFQKILDKAYCLFFGISGSNPIIVD